jgi:hypothetical protein
MAQKIVRTEQGNAHFSNKSNTCQSCYGDVELVIRRITIAYDFTCRGQKRYSKANVDGLRASELVRV